MAGRITELAVLTGPAVADLLEVVDISDTSMAATGTNKKLTVAELGTQTVQTVAGATYTVVAGDVGTLIRLTGTATVTLPSAGPAAGQRVDFVCVGGPATFTLGGGATWDVAPTPSAVARAVGSFVTAVKMGAAAWALTGDLA